MRRPQETKKLDAQRRCEAVPADEIGEPLRGRRDGCIRHGEVRIDIGSCDPIISDRVLDWSCDPEKLRAARFCAHVTSLHYDGLKPGGLLESYIQAAPDFCSALQSPSLGQGSSTLLRFVVFLGGRYTLTGTRVQQGLSLGRCL